MDKSAFFKFCPEEEKMRGIGYLLLEMFQIRRHINVLNMQPEIASIFFNKKWNKPMTGYRIIKVNYTFGKSVNVKEDAQKRRTGDSIYNKPTTSAKFVSKPASKQTTTSIVDLILLEES
jgi:hypothetical protein